MAFRNQKNRGKSHELGTGVKGGVYTLSEDAYIHNKYYKAGDVIVWDGPQEHYMDSDESTAKAWDKIDAQEEKKKAKEQAEIDADPVAKAKAEAEIKAKAEKEAGTLGRPLDADNPAL